MNKNQVLEHINEPVQQGDVLVGFFQATQSFKIWLFFLIGPLAVLSMKFYFVAVTQQGIYFHRLNLWGKFSDYDFFTFDEIQNVEMGDGYLQKPMRYYFKNGRKLKLKAQLKGSQKVAKLDDETLEYIKKRLVVL